MRCYTVLQVTIVALSVAAVSGSHRNEALPAKHEERTVRPTLSREAAHARELRAEGDSLYAGGDYAEAIRRYEEMVETFSASEDPQTQDQVGVARLRLGYAVSKSGDFAAARRWFEEAATEYRGTNKMDAAYGTISEQGEYQAAVCLAAMDREEEAERAFLSFIEMRPLSPLVHAAHRRLVRLNEGESAPRYDRALSRAVRLQQEAAKLEMAMCGPKAAARLIELMGRGRHDPRELASKWKVTADGMTMQELRDGLKSLGIETWGYTLNRRDFGTLPTPAIWLSDRHFRVVMEIRGNEALVFDPFVGTERAVSLPAIDDADFTAVVLSTRTLNLGGGTK